jgi:hypothetical protein
LSDGFATAGVFVVGGDVADAGVQSGAVVEAADAAELAVEHGGVGDLLEVRPLAFDVPEEALDPRLIGRGVGSAETLGDGQAGEEVAGRLRGHLGPVVGAGEQDRAGRIVDGELEPLGGDLVGEALGDQRLVEQHLDLGGGLLDRHERVDPAAETTSTIAKATRRARLKWVTSQHQIRFGAHSNQSGQSGFGVGSRLIGSGRTSP